MRFSASKALSESFGIFTGRFGAMLPIAALFTLLPVALLMAYFSGNPAFAGQNQGNPAAALQAMFAMAGSLFLVFIAYMVVRSIGVCALCSAASSRQPLSFGDAVGKGLRSVLPLLGVYLILGIAYLALALVVVLALGGTFAAMFGGAAGGRAPGGGSIAGIAFLIVALAAGVFYLFAKLSMIVPIIAIDDERSPVGAISRSWKLTRGASFKILLLFLLTGLGAGIVNAVAGAFTGGVNAMATSSAGIAWPQVIVSSVLGAAFAMYFISLIVAIHDQLSGPSAAAIGDTFG